MSRLCITILLKRKGQGAAQCGDSPGFRRGVGRGKGGWDESSLFALPGGQRFSGHCGPEGRIKIKRCPEGRRMEYRQTEAVWTRLRLSAGIFMPEGLETWEV